MSANHYRMTISRMTVDKLGVKLYERVALVIAELVANGYDADASTVTIEAPMDTMLASVRGGIVTDSNYKIVVRDDGIGMSPDVVNPFYLKVGGERRKDQSRGNLSPKYHRRVMGRKGVGKLAPFGICGTIEVITSGGKQVSGTDAEGHRATGYRTAHFIMRRQDIISDEDSAYEPAVGKLDDTISPTHGTKLVLSDFAHRRVPDIDDFSRQLGQRFGLVSANWRILLVDSTKAPETLGREKVVGGLEIERMDATEIRFRGPQSESVEPQDARDYQTEDSKGNVVSNITAGFMHADGRFYPVLGWVAYAKQSYRDDLMAGIRIYCRGKIAAQTNVFNRKSGFTGEFTVRSYLVGELHADWLDEDEDLIQTDRRDILWSDDLGQAFQTWGRGIVELVGTMSRDPVKKATWDRFLEASDIVNKVDEAYPGEEWKSVRNTTLGLAKKLGERLRPDEVDDAEHIKTLVQLSLMLGPHVELDHQLNEAADQDAGSLQLVADILRTARVAELSSYGLIADKRVKVIDRITTLKDDPSTLEEALQSSIEAAPWLINPQWSPIAANQTLETLRQEFTKYYEQVTGKKINLDRFEKGNKRPDFVLSSQDGRLQIIEIKRPVHGLENSEWDRIQTYQDVMRDFLDRPGHSDFVRLFRGFRITLVCDGLKLSGSQRAAFKAALASGDFEHVTWTAFLARTRQTHQEFLAEADRQRRLAVNL